MNKVWIIIIGLVAAGGLVFFLLSGDDSEVSTGTDSQNQSSQTAEPDEIATEDPSSDNAPGKYVEYDAAAVSTTDGKQVLFFHASWCPTCRALDQNINAGVLPDDLTVYKVDYDTEDDLRMKHGVTYQHTLVQIDSEGNQINKWSGTFTIDQLVDELI